MNQQPNLVITTAPFLVEGTATPGIMKQVIYALIPLVIASTYYFGITALLVILCTTVGAVLTEYLPLVPIANRHIRSLN